MYIYGYHILYVPLGSYDLERCAFALWKGDRAGPRSPP